MNNPNNLFNMMQTGGLTSSAGGTALARALQMQSDRKRLEEQQRKEAKRQKRGGLFGSLGSLAGGLLGAALSPFTGGLSLALAAGVGSAAGKRIGEGLGAGKSRKYDRSGTVFGQQDFRDVEQASRDYTRGMGERALLSGLQTALTAGLTPGGGIYGKVGGKLRTLGTVGSGVAPVAAPLADTSSLFPNLGASSQSSSLFSIPKSSFVPAGYGSSTVSNFTGGSPQIGYNQPLLNFFEDGGYTGYQNGGYTTSGILSQAGFDPTGEQLALFQEFDPTKIQQAKADTEQSLMSMTGGMGLSSMGGGFGARQRATTSAIGRGEDLIGDTIAQEQKAFESQTLGTAADLIASGAEIEQTNTHNLPDPDSNIVNPNWFNQTGADGRVYNWNPINKKWVAVQSAEEYFSNVPDNIQYNTTESEPNYGGS